MNQNNFTQQPKIDHQSILFVSDLPKETTEEDLAYFFRNYHFTLAKIFRQRNTYAHVYFENPDYAKKARKDLNGEILIPKFSQSRVTKPVRICKYEMKTQVAENIKDASKSLIVKNLLSEVTSKDLYKMFEEFGEITSSKLEVDQNGVSRNYGFVHFSDSESAEAAKQKLNGKEIKGRRLEVLNLIPLKVKDKACNVYVKNIPRDFSDADLKEVFSKYGDITSTMVSKDDKGFSRGFGYVCFTNNVNAVQAINDLKEKSLSFPGLPPLYVNILMKKEERDALLNRSYNKIESPKFLVRIMFDPYIQSEEDFDRELRLFIKVILLQEYSPQKIEINFEGKYAIVTMNSNKDIEDFYKKYAEHCQYNYPRFYIEPYVEPKVSEEQVKGPVIGYPGKNVNPYMLINQFGNMSLNPNLNQNLAPLQPPVFFVDPNKPINMGSFRNFNQRVPLMNVQMKPPQMGVHFGKPMTQGPFVNTMATAPTGTTPQQFRTDFGKNVNASAGRKGQTAPEESALMEDVASLIYDEVEKKFSDDAGKITGMIVDLGLEEMRKLLTQRDKLGQVIDEAHEMLHKDK